MNYLAHLHIANCADSHLLGNLLGDFVKGDPSVEFPSDVANGIRLHRRVDSFTDTHPCSKNIKLFFPQPLRRFVPIALDMFWDHCLANQWTLYDHRSLDEFVENTNAKILIQEQQVNLPVRYVQMTDKLWKQQWLQSYADMENILYAISRIAQRSVRLQQLDQCSHYLERHYFELIEYFHQLYPQVLSDASNFQRDLQC